MPSQIITVFGATGCQGGSVARALLKGGQFKVRAVTRSPDSDAAKALAKEGADVVQAEMNDRASLVSALQGSYGCFAVTTRVVHTDNETKQGKDIADVCKETGVKHYVYSGLENAKAITGLPTPHFDSKAMVEEYLKDLGTPYTIVRVPYYCENLLTLMAPKKLEDNTFGLYIPMADKKMHVVPVKEIGECVHQIFLQKTKFLGKSIGFASDYLTIAEMAEIITQELGTTVIDGKMTTEAYAKFDFPEAEYLANIFTLCQTGKLVRDIELTKQLNPTLSTFKQWVKDNKQSLKVAMNL